MELFSHLWNGSEFDGMYWCHWGLGEEELLQDWVCLTGSRGSCSRGYTTLQMGQGELSAC